MLHVNLVTLTKLTSLFTRHAQANRRLYTQYRKHRLLPGRSLLSAYAASKAYVLTFSRGLYQELRKTNVSVTCICPGPTDTNFVNRANIGVKGIKAAEKFNMTRGQ